MMKTRDLIDAFERGELRPNEYPQMIAAVRAAMPPEPLPLTVERVAGILYETRYPRGDWTEAKASGYGEAWRDAARAAIRLIGRAMLSERAIDAAHLEYLLSERAIDAAHLEYRESGGDTRHNVNAAVRAAVVAALGEAGSDVDSCVNCTTNQRANKAETALASLTKALGIPGADIETALTRVREVFDDRRKVDAGFKSAQEVALAHANRAEQAERDRDALATEVEALRGLPRNWDAVKVLLDAFPHAVRTGAVKTYASNGLADVLATVPRAKLGAAVDPKPGDDAKLGAVARTPPPRLATDDEIDASDCPLTAADIGRLVASSVYGERLGPGDRDRALAWLVRREVGRDLDRGSR